MWRKRLSLTVVFLLGFAGSIATADVTAGLVGYWPLDGDAIDASGNGLDGQIFGNVVPTEGKDGMPNSAMLFDGNRSDYIELGDPPALAITGAITLAAWIRVDSFDANGRVIARIGTANNRSYSLNVENESNGHVGAFQIGTEGGRGILIVNTAQRLEARPDEWVHIAGTYEPGVALKFYLNGAFNNQVTQNVPTEQNIANTVRIGRSGTTWGEFAGSIDEVYVFSRALSAADIKELVAGEPGIATNPSPADEAPDVPRDVVLSWTPGKYAPALNGHRVYLSENFSDVDNGVGSVTVSTNSYTPARRLAFETTYYWRVDEVNGPPDYTVYTGDVWQFRTEPFSYAIENVIATASSSSPGKGSENTVNGSGLDDSGLLHTNISQDAMWLSRVVNAMEPAWIAFEFDNVHKLHEMWVWNSNDAFETAVGFGLRDVTIEYSADGTNYTTLGTTHEFAQASGTTGYAHDTTIDFDGAPAKYVRLTANSVWGSSLAGLSEVRFFYTPVGAREPSPDSGATDVDPDVVLGWRAGREAAKHEVYLSTNEQAVIDGTAPMVSMTEPTHAVALDLGSTYYWRIDEVNDAETPVTWQGEIWNLSTKEYIVVDDFESYNDIETGQEGSRLIYETWMDGYGTTTNGSAMGYTVPFEPTMETSTVFDGKQSVPLSYDNTVALYSEVTASVANLQGGQDWSKYGIKGLTLRFYGDPNNSVNDRMYVKINGAKAAYDGEAENLTRAAWQMWYVDLTSLGVNLSNVTELAIGFERVGASGGQGLVLFDGIRLYSYDRQLITPIQPGNADLAGHWEFDEGSGTTVRDSSGNNGTGTLVGAAEWVAGIAGSALKFDDGEYVDVGPPTPAALSVQQDITIAAWGRPHQILAQWQVLFSMQRGSSGGEAYAMAYGRNTNRLTAIFNTAGGNGSVVDPAPFDLGEWIHAAATYDGNKVVLYRNGQPVAENSASFSGPLNHGDGMGRFAINGNYNSLDGGLGEYCSSTIDDVRVYGRVLSPEEILYLSGVTNPFDKPF